MLCISICDGDQNFRSLNLVLDRLILPWNTSWSLDLLNYVRWIVDRKVTTPSGYAHNTSCNAITWNLKSAACVVPQLNQTTDGDRPSMYYLLQVKPLRWEHRMRLRISRAALAPVCRRLSHACTVVLQDTPIITYAHAQIQTCPSSNA